MVPLQEAFWGGNRQTGIWPVWMDVVDMVTMVQLEEYLKGWTMLSWYNILQTVTTQVQTVQTPNSRGRHAL